MAQRQFWNGLLRDSVPFVELLVSVPLVTQSDFAPALCRFVRNICYDCLQLRVGMRYH
jgi:hypothetical protein